MDADRWRRISELYHEAAARQEKERAAFLATACAGDAALRREVESLLDSPPTDEGVLAAPVLAAAAQMLSDGAASVLTGRRIGVYVLHERIGAGGMGEVYRARDSRLGRDVAVKLLPHPFTADPDRLARFEREARILAALNHPNIATIHGVEDSDGVPALVMELVEGATLAERLARGALPVPEALAVAGQVADALDAAHEKGIIHRDLKPANIKVTATGIVKVLDFGLAKAVRGDGTGVDLSQLPTMTAEATRQGLMVGTPGYMSPEQARGHPVDRRTDIWAFGCVLYEMLAGRAAFARETVSDTIASILEREPDWTRLPRTTPRTVRALLKRCLEKDPKRRVRDIGDARIEMDESSEDRGEDVPRTASRIPIWTALAIGMLIGATAALLVRSRPAASAEAPTHLTFTAPEEAPQISGSPVPSPDGQHIAYVAMNAAGERGLWIRSLDSPTPRRIAGTDGASNPFWSPDALSVGFGAPAEGRLKRVDLSRSYVQNIGNMRDAIFGATWSREDIILFSPDNRVPLYSVPASGGTAEAVTTLDPTRRENSHRWPHFLPDGRQFLFTARSDVKENTGIYVGSLGSKAKTWLVEAQSNAVYAAPGYLLFVREGTLLAQSFDTATLRLSGQPFAVAGNVSHQPAGASALFSASADGRVVAYRSATESTGELVWFDRNGVKVGPILAEGNFEQVRLAPDGKHAAVVASDRDSGNRDIWLVDVTGGTRTRFTSHPANDWQSVWSPDGTQLAFASDRDGLSAVYRKAADGSGPESLISTAAVPGNRFPNDWSADGRLLAVHSSTPETALDVWVVPNDGRKAYEIARTTFQEHSARLSPDGRWVAYVSDESGTPEVYIQTLGNAAKRRISTSGGRGPRWRADGRELFFVDATNRLMTVAVGSGEIFVGSSPVALFNTCGGSTSPELFRYDIAADGARSLWLCPSPRTTASVVTVSIQALPRSKREN